MGKFWFVEKVEERSYFKVVKKLRNGRNGVSSDFLFLRRPRGNGGFVFDGVVSEAILRYNRNRNIGRELKMKELKQKIAELEEKLENNKER